MPTKKDIQYWLKYYTHDLDFIGKKFYCIPKHIYDNIMEDYKE